VSLLQTAWLLLSRIIEQGATLNKGIRRRTMKLRSILGVVLSLAMLMMIGCGGGGGGGAVGGGVQSTITATAGPGGNISPSGAVLVASGANQTFTITPDAGSNVADVVVDGVSQGAITTFTFTNVIADHTITATFIANPATPTITATAGAGGTINPSGAIVVTPAANQTFTITPDAGFGVADVVVDGVSQGAIAAFTFSNVIADHTITASFIANPALSITATAGAGGAISPTGAVIVASAANQTFTITPNAGFGVADVAVDGVSQGALTTFTFTNVTANHTITASFVGNPTTAVVTVATQGTLPAGTVIGAIQATMNFTTPGLAIVDADVVLSGPAAAVPNTIVFPNTTTAGQLTIGLISATGIQTGQFATATFSVSAGTFPTAADFSIAAGATVFDLNGVLLPGISVVIGTVIIQ
jgi:hypothetical protein